MKKFIPILTLVVSSAYLQNCTNREEDIDSKDKLFHKTEKPLMKKQDSAKLSEQDLDPDPSDPPVRDGDNWRLYENENTLTL